jgi:hypothetical protein
MPDQNQYTEEIFDRSTGKNTSVCVLVLGNWVMVLLLMMNLHSLKEVLDNCIDEFVMGAGKTIEVTIRDKTVNVRDYGRGIPLGKVIDVVSNEYRWKIRPWLLRNQWFERSGTKVNALSNYFVWNQMRNRKPPNFQLVI